MYCYGVACDLVSTVRSVGLRHCLCVVYFFFLLRRRQPGSSPPYSSAASEVYERQAGALQAVPVSLAAWRTRGLPRAQEPRGQGEGPKHPGLDGVGRKKVDLRSIVGRIYFKTDFEII